jgi:beta-galactosidase
MYFTFSPFKIICTTVIIICSCMIIIPCYGQSPLPCGDVDDDNSIDIIDALLTAQFYVGLQPANFNQDHADVNNSGDITIIDALLIAQYYVGLIDTLSCGTTPGEPGERITLNFNRDWMYIDSNISNGQDPGLNESSFQNNICLPHANRIIRHRYDSDAEFRFISWYRKHFTPPSAYEGKRYIITFQGVATVATVYVNGQYIGEHKGAYTEFSFDITDAVTPGDDNVIAVQVDSRQRTDIPPEGSTVDYMIFGGIVRDVILAVTDPLYAEWVFVSTPSVSQNSATVNVKTKVVNASSSQKNCTVESRVLDSAGIEVTSVATTQTIQAQSTFEFNHTTNSISQPNLWHPDHPYLYTVETNIKDGSVIVDDCTEQMGIRSVSFNASTGNFSINGQVFKLRGLNRHETYPFIGRAASNRLQAKDADILKYDLGCNIVRCSHYPQDPEFFDRCDEIGLLAIEEVPGWQYVGGSSWQDLLMQALEEMILAHRNHPSIISFGVRVNESADNRTLYTQTNALARQLDPTRQTHGVRRSNGSTSEFLEDVWTRNFYIPTGFPDPSPWVTTETVGHNFPTHSWDSNQHQIDHMFEHVDRQSSNYSNPNIGGVLGWCAFDYNSSHPNAVGLEGGSYVSYHGVADIYRIPKIAGYFFQSQRDPVLYGPMVYITHQWESALSSNTVTVVSNCEEVELMVNGSSSGRISPNRNNELPHGLFQFSNIPYQPGEIRALGYIGGEQVVEHTRHTPGAPAAMVLTPDSQNLVDSGDMTRVVVTIVDQYGQVVPRADNSVTLSVNGPGEFLGESTIVLEDGKGAFYIKTRMMETGTITCQASSQGVSSGSCTIAVTTSPEVYNF